MDIIIDNVESIARDNLANERTLLSWIRTSLGLVTLGLFIMKFSNDIVDHIISMLIIILSTVFACFGLWRFIKLDQLLMKKQYAKSTTIIIIIISTVVMLQTFFIGYAVYQLKLK